MWICCQLRPDLFAWHNQARTVGILTMPKEGSGIEDGGRFEGQL